jgi:tetratricopeptide (TPR) repeat protein
MNLDRETWLRVEPLFNTALGLTGPARTAWLVEAEARAPDLAPLLRRLISTHERAERNAELETVPKLAAAPPTASSFNAGQSIGDFTLVAPLGRGGMGEVWRARQDDGRVEREVALKLPFHAGHGAPAAERFRREKNILASLNHPRIAHLIDAGVDYCVSGGQAWLALELVEGVALNAYLDERKPPQAARIALFLQVLDAVAHAHRHLVIHRDLKPANIVVDAAGNAKLLDFGIAKLIEGDAREVEATELTRAGGRAMTLRYCAPEQITGEAISTATDIYALGVILFETLAGTSPYRAVREARALTETAIAREDIARPSVVAQNKGLAGDLDAIVLKALRREPAQRYATVEAFANDLQATLEQRPVSAREGTRRYLIGRFALRHKWPIAAGSAVLIALGAGLGIAESQRREAVAERARAERHLASVRTLASSLIFDVHDDILNLSGATPARKKLIEQAERYLSALALEPGADAALIREQAQAYLRLGNLRGASNAQSLGDPMGALANYDRALGLLDKVAPSSVDPKITEDRAVLLRQKSQVLFDVGRRDESSRAAEQGLVHARALVGVPNPTVEHLAMFISMRVEAARRNRETDHEGARIAGLNEALEFGARALNQLPADAPAASGQMLRESIAWASSEFGHVLRHKPDPATRQQAVAHFRRALEIRESHAVLSPADVSLRRSAEANRTFIGLTLLDLHQYPEAASHLAQAARAIEALSAADPANVQFRKDTAFILVSANRAQIAAGQPQVALESALRASSLYALLPDTMTGSDIVKSEIARSHLAAARAHLALSAALPAAASARRLHIELAAQRLNSARSVVATMQVSATDPGTRERTQAEVDRLAKSLEVAQR